MRTPFAVVSMKRQHFIFPFRYLHLFYYEDYSVREIADILKLSESNVKDRLSRGRALLRDSLKEEWENDNSVLVWKLHHLFEQVSGLGIRKSKSFYVILQRAFVFLPESPVYISGLINDDPKKPCPDVSNSGH